MKKIYKVSIVFRTFDTLYDFMKKEGKSFWDEFEDDFKKQFPGCDYIIEKKGNSNALLYIPAETVPDKSDIREIMGRLLGDTDDFILSLLPLKDDEIIRIGERNPSDIKSKEWFSKALKECSSSEKTDTVKQSSTEERAKKFKEIIGADIADDENGHDDTSSEDETAPEKISGDLSLFDEIQKIEELKAQLLKRIYGQRHAIDEFVQAIFECDAFARHNEERSGPLATFLFAGPSGVGKTFFAKTCSMLLNREKKVIDMSEYSDNLSNGKLNGEHGNEAAVTGFVKKHPDGILIFDEIEKAHINTIHCFLQILDAGVMTDARTGKKVSFKDNIIIFTTNAGKSLYEDTTRCNLSSVPKNTVLEALRTDIDKSTNQPFFPECITTRFANGHVILFNHLEPFALSEIVRTEIELQFSLFKKAYGVNVNCDTEKLAAMALYNAGGVTDARTLRGTVRNVIIGEVQEAVVQAYRHSDKDVNLLENINIIIDPDQGDETVRSLFEKGEDTRALVFADDFILNAVNALNIEGASFVCTRDIDTFKREMHTLADLVLIDPFCGVKTNQRIPNDVEDIDSEGMELISYIHEYYPEMPVYILDAKQKGESAYNTMLSTGCRGVVNADAKNMTDEIGRIIFSAVINNSAYKLSRSGKILTYNCAQYTVDEKTAEISFNRLMLKLAPRSGDAASIVHTDKSTGITFEKVCGCTSAKKTLSEFKKYIENPREFILKGQRIPRGVLLYGPPGTGKTMLAKALANEAGVPFFQETATNLFNMYVGETEKNIRELFAKARRYAPSIVFIDEVDAIGRKRTGGSGSKHNEDALTTFLAQMDGFATDVTRPVFVVAATNYAISGDGETVLDGAFVRRFDKRIFVGLPDFDERVAFFKMKFKERGIKTDADFENIIKKVSARSGGLSNADLDLVVEACLAENENGELNSAALMEALDTYRFGESNKIDPDRLRQTACHEAGHALIYRLICKKTPAFLTVVSRGNFGGFMEHTNEETKSGYTYKELMELTCCSLAGRVAEIVVYGDELGLNTGASSDISMARRYIHIALTDFAMGVDIYHADDKDGRGETLMREQYERTLNVIKANTGTLNDLTDYLAKERNLDSNQLEKFFESHNI